MKDKRRAVLGRIERAVGEGRFRLHVAWVTSSVLLIVFVAYALRVGTLTLQSMWIDEVMALHFTRAGILHTIREMARPQHNGPLFYLLISGWRSLVGDSDLAIRYMSTAFSVLTLCLLFRWARELFAARTAIVAVWLFAFSPFSLWYAQEAKMYALHMMAAVASSLVLLEAFRKGRWWRWLLYAILVPAVLYSHFFGMLLVVSQVGMALLLGWRRWRRLLVYVLTMLLLAAAHLPLARIGWSVLRNYRPRDIWRGFVPLGTIVRDAFGTYFYRLSMPNISWPAFLLPAALILCGSLSLLLLRWRERGVVLLHALAPLLIFYPLSFKVPIYTAKYLSAVFPALVLLVAWGTEALSRLWRLLGLGVLVLGMMMLNGIVRDLTDPVVQRSDWRFVADYVAAHEGGDDLVVVSADYAQYAFRRYFDGVSHVLGFGDNPYDPAAYYQRQAENYDRMWLVLHQDDAMAPGNVLRETANVLFPVVSEQFPNGGQITLIGYQMRFTYPVPPEGTQPLDHCFENGLCLVGYWVDATTLTATENLSHPPSNWLHVVLYWRREPQVDDVAFRPLVRLVDDDFLVWGGNMERRPDLFDRFPPADWPQEEVIETHFDLNLNPVTPAGTYRVEVSLAVEGDESRRVAVQAPPPGAPADRVVFEQIVIQSE